MFPLHYAPEFSTKEPSISEEFLKKFFLDFPSNFPVINPTGSMLRILFAFLVIYHLESFFSFCDGFLCSLSFRRLSLHSLKGGSNPFFIIGAIAPKSYSFLRQLLTEFRILVIPLRGNLAIALRQVNFTINERKPAFASSIKIVGIVAQAECLSNEFLFLLVHFLFRVENEQNFFAKVVAAILPYGSRYQLPRPHVPIIQVVSLMFANVHLSVDDIRNLIDGKVHGS